MVLTKRILAAAGVFFVAYVVMMSALSPAAGSTDPKPSPIVESESTSAQGVYTLTELDGRVAVYLDGVLYLKTDTPVDSLPKRDRERLREGIRFESREELTRLVEDYCS